MKKVLMILGFLVMGSYASADNNVGLMGAFGDYKVWKSTEVNKNETRVIISTGDIMIGFVQVLSTGQVSGIVFQQVGTTVATFSSEWLNYYSSAPKSGVQFDTIDYQQNPGIYVMARSTIGWCYTTTGNPPAKLRILWDFVTAPR